jgi:hypothetical protein
LTDERIDGMPLGELTAEVMESLDEAYGEDCHISMGLVAVEVDLGDQTKIYVRATDERAWVLEKFLEEALDYINYLRQAPREAESE